MGLAEKHCAACAKGTPALPADQARALLGQVPGWTVSPDGKWLLQSRKFGNFVDALAFVKRVGELAEEEQHHPDLELGWGYVNVRLQTHAAGGLHENDFILAAKIEKIQPLA